MEGSPLLRFTIHHMLKVKSVLNTFTPLFLTPPLGIPPYYVTFCCPRGTRVHEIHPTFKYNGSSKLHKCTVYAKS